MTGELSDAIKEAYATAPQSDIIFHTLEIIHPNFTDENGNRTAIRVVRNFEDITATLESTAPLNPSEQVVFSGYAFELKFPESSSAASRIFQIVIDNVSPLIGESVDRAKGSVELVKVIYRPYIESNLALPQIDPPPRFVLRGISLDELKVTATASFEVDLSDRTFPRELYKIEDFPGLRQ